MNEKDFTSAFAKGPHRTVDVGHSEVATWSFGKGPDLVFVHGWPLWSATYRRIAPQLADDFTLHFLDLPGAGFSRCEDPRRVTFSDHVDVVKRVVAALGLGRHGLVGHDSGGAILRKYARQRDDVFGMVLGNTETPDHVPWQVKMYVVLARLGLGRALTRSLGIGLVRRSALGLGGCFADPRYGDGEFYELFLRELVEGGPASAGALAFVDNVRPDDLADLRQVHTELRFPVSLVWGTDDPFFPLAGARTMVGDFAGGAELHELRGGKLFVHEDMAESFGPIASSFLRRVAQPAPRERAPLSA